MTANRSDSDYDLFRRLAAEDDLPALDMLFERYWKKLYAAGYVRLRDEAEAKDCVQEIFIGLWQRRKQLSVPESVSAYLYQALKNRVINALHSRMVREKHMSRYVENIDDCYQMEPGAFELKEMSAVVEDEIARMPEQMRAVYLLSRHDSLSGLEIAGRLGLSHQTVRNQISIALKRIRARLQQYEIQ